MQNASEGVEDGVSDVREYLLTRIRQTDAGCWEWTRASSSGYGTLGPGREERKAHRLSYRVFVGPMPAGLVIDHLCRNTLCINPLHLEPVTARVNTLRGVSPLALLARQETCINGHPLISDRIVIRRRGNEGRERRCIECQRRYNREYARRARAARKNL